MRILLILLSLYLGTFHASAQSDFPSFEELQRRMMDLQRQMMQEFRAHPFGRLDMPSEGRDSSTHFFRFDTTFSWSGKDGFFHLDTTLSDGSTMQFFRFSPSEDGQEGGGNWMQSFEQMFGDMMGSPRKPRTPRDNFPKDDGSAEPSEDDLLPEERLRQAEKAPADTEKTQTQETPKNTPAKKPKISTVRS